MAVKLNEDDEHFLETPQGSAMVSSGASGTQSWLERDKDVTVRLVISAVAVATADGATLDAVIEIEGAAARAQDGPSPHDTHLQAVQSVQILVKQGQRVSFKAYPQAASAKVVKTVVYTVDMK